MDEVNECLCGLAITQEDQVNNLMTAVQRGYRGCEPGWVGSFSVLFYIQNLMQIHSSFILTVFNFEVAPKNWRCPNHVKRQCQR
jgi:hypothetical protein